MPQRRGRVFKSQGEKSTKELQTQERKRRNTLLGKAHQLFAAFDAKIALIIQCTRTGRQYSYHSHDDWPPGTNLEALVNMTENLGPSDFTEHGKRKNGKYGRRKRLPGSGKIYDRLCDLKSRKEPAKGMGSPKPSIVSVEPSFVDVPSELDEPHAHPLGKSWLDVVLQP